MEYGEKAVGRLFEASFPKLLDRIYKSRFRDFLLPFLGIHQNFNVTRKSQLQYVIGMVCAVSITHINQCR